MRRGWIAALAAMAASAPGAVAAHTMVKSVSIAEGARLKAAPPQVTVTMGHAVGVGSVSLATAAGKDVPLAFKPPRALAKSFTVPLPKLPADAYRLSWRIIADDGHVMMGGVSFTVTGAR